jgi:serine/threonine protein kinase, bacterial
VDNVEFQLLEAMAFDWLEPLGTVFAVFDQQDSGNLCFGIQTHEGKRVFAKFAGARPIEYAGRPEEAIPRLQQAVPVYQTLQHPTCVEMLDAFSVPQGYVIVFDWFDGECLHAHWKFPPPAKYEHPASPFYRFQRLTLPQKLSVMDGLIAFHVHVEACGYVAIDFYDGSILYDFENHQFRVCDIDFYRPRPYVNQMGRLWGSSRFMSPEEFQFNSLIDERTNVFNMGATAFVLLGGESDRSRSKWQASPALYDVTSRCIQPDRNERYSSVSAVQEAWMKAR